MSRLYDCFMYAGEADMLEFRLTELEGKVHRHVLVESPVTHRGLPKPLWYAERDAERFLRYAGRIVYVVAKSAGPVDSDWGREHWQRDLAGEHMKDAQPDDLVLISDVDEIPSDSALAAEPAVFAALNQRIFHSAVDWEYPAPQLTSVLVRAGCAEGLSFGKIRDGRYGYPVLQEAGWHFSCLGTTEDRRSKLERTCHTEMPAAEWEAIASGATWERGEHHSADSQVQAVDVDKTWPRYVYERRCPDSWFRPR